VDVINSGIAIAKTPDAQTIVSGSTVTFTINVTNTGDVPLTNVTVSDALAPNCARTFATLTAGQKQTYTCTRGNVTADFTNSATATGTPPVGNVVSATDTALVDVIHPAIDIAKTPDTQTIVSGSTATFTLAVTNTGDVSLTNVTVSDALAPNCARTFATLTAGQKQTYTCTRANVTADFTNSATATGTPPVGSAVSDTDTALVDVIHPAIDIAKTPDTQVIVSGSTVTFTITVTNTGDVPLTNVTISDALAPNCSRALATLAVGAKGSYTCTLANVRADFTNTATTACTSPIGSVTTDADTAQVIIDDTLACPAGMVAYWKLDESSGPPYDDYYRNHNGTCAGQCPTSVAGHINAGQAFNSSTTGINVPADKAFNWGLTDSFSIELWMRTNSASTCAGNQVIVGRDENANALHWWVGCKVGGQAAFYLRDKNSTLAGVTATKDVSDGVWHHIVAARDGNANKLLIFVDGVEQGSTSAIYTSGFDSTTAELNIGWLDALQGYHFEGIADEVAVYDRALAPAEIQRHYFDGLVGRWYCEIIAPAPNAHSIFLPIIRKGS
jgi:uncharacterized repeat protein (TIGR01451 family)